MKLHGFKLKNWMFCALFLFIPTQAFAYLDPGSISLVLQAIIAGFAGLIATYKLWIFKIKSLFFRKKKFQDLNQSSSESEKNN
jgi:uncharacterized membrane protein